MFSILRKLLTSTDVTGEGNSSHSLQLETARSMTKVTLAEKPPDQLPVMPPLDTRPLPVTLHNEVDA